MKKKRTRTIVLVVILVLVICCCCAPVPVACGAPYALCRTAPFPGVGSKIFYELEPAGLMIIELIIQDNIPIYYFRWESSN
jgi:hypothetical protein